jgi:DNA-binding transcriptional regulator YiaG
LGVHLSTVHHWARGLSQPSPETRARLVEVLSSLPTRPKEQKPRSKAELRRTSSFALWLAERKRERDLSVSEMANALGVGKSTVSGWLSGRNQPMPETCEKLAGVLGISLEDLLASID